MPSAPGPPTSLLVCRKWVDRRPVVDPVTGEWEPDPRTSGTSEADDAALEWGLRLGTLWGLDVAAVTVGPPGAEAVCVDALAAGVARAWRIPAEAHTPSETVAASIAGFARVVGATMVLCGDLSADRGTGAVPAFLAHHLGAAQALGTVELDPDPDRVGHLQARRRLDGGRREHLEVGSPFVVSVEGSTAALRRAPLSGVLRAHHDEVVLFETPLARELPVGSPTPPTVGPYRPRTHLVAPPDPHLDARGRVLDLLGLASGSTRRRDRRLLVLDPPEAATAVLEALASWGIALPDPGTGEAGR